jgi:hypothetical protein
MLEIGGYKVRKRARIYISKLTHRLQVVILANNGLRVNTFKHFGAIVKRLMVIYINDFDFMDSLL